MERGEPAPRFVDLDAAIRVFVARYVAEAVASCGGNRDAAARLLKISIRTLYRHLAAAREVNQPIAARAASPDAER